MRSKLGIYDVLVINANTRHVMPEIAKAIIRSILSHVAHEYPYVYLKTDSALRGNISALFRAALDELPHPWIFVPAYPAFNRVTKDGKQYIGKVLLEDSPFRDDPLNPMNTSDIREIVCKDFDNPVKVFPESFVKQGTVEQLDPHGINVFDCTNKRIMYELATILAVNDAVKYMSGCAGMASVLHHILPFNTKKLEVEILPQSVIVFSGSINDINTSQLQHAQNDGYSIYFLSVDRIANGEESELIEEAAQRIQEAIRKNETLIVSICDLTPGSSEIKADQKIHKSIEAFWQRLTLYIYEQFPIKHMAIFGGDTALAVLTALNIDQVVLQKEVEEGVPHCIFNWREHQIHLVTKSGGLGGLSVVNHIDQYFRNV
jgi:D-threonate/D-erythronate kinase